MLVPFMENELHKYMTGPYKQSFGAKFYCGKKPLLNLSDLQQGRVISCSQDTSIGGHLGLLPGPWADGTASA